MVSAGCTLAGGQPVMRTVPPVTTAAARNGTALDRSGSIVPVPRGDRARGDPPPVGLRRRRRRRRRRAASPPSSRRAAPTAPTSPVCTIVSPSVNAAPDSSRPETNCDDADASISTVPPAHRSGAAHRERQAVAVDADAEAAQRVEQRRDRAGAGLLVAVERRPSSVLSAASGGTNRSTVPASPQSTRAPAAGAMRAADGQLGVVAVDARRRASAARRSSGRCRGCAARR